MCGGGNAANVAFDLFKMKIHNGDVVIGEGCSSMESGFCTIIRLISKIGNDVIGKSIMKEFKELENYSSNRCRFDTSGIIISNDCQSSFSYIMVTPSENSNEAFDRTIINTPLSESFEFEELDERLCCEYKVDLLFLDGRYSDVAIQYIDSNRSSIGYIVMECERMRFGIELKCFLELISKSNIISLSEGFEKEYFEYYLKHVAESKNEKEWIEELTCNFYDQHLISLHLLYLLLKDSGGKIPSFIIQTLGSRGSICMTKTKQDENHYRVKSLTEIIPKETINISPQTQLFSFSFSDKNGTQQFYTIIYCQAYSNSELPIVDGTGAGDSFNAATLYTLQRFIEDENLYFDTSSLEKLLKFSSISAVYCCSAIGARTRIIDSINSSNIWNNL